METIKEKALSKMLQEMQNNKSRAIDKIHTWICNQDDQKLFEGILKDGKTLENAFKYAAKKAMVQQISGVAAVDDEEVYEWIVEYFKSTETSVSVPAFASSTSGTPKKAKAKDQSKEYDELLDEEDEANTYPTKTDKPKKIAKPNNESVSQLSIFEL